jgi:hypothetical protein
MLVQELYRIFGTRMFDATDAWCESHNNPALTAAIDAEVPRARLKSGYLRGELNRRSLRMALRRLHQKGLVARRRSTDAREGYWVFRCQHQLDSPAPSDKPTTTTPLGGL